MLIHFTPHLKPIFLACDYGVGVRYPEQGRKSTAAEARSRIVCLLMKNEELSDSRLLDEPAHIWNQHHGAML